MLALLLALSLVAHTAHTHAHKRPHRHAHRHAHVVKHNPAPVHRDRCAIDARRVVALELRIESATDREAELQRLEDQLKRAIERAQRDCGS